MIKLFNAFSLQMLPESPIVTVHISEFSARSLTLLIERQGVESYIGHEDTAKLLSNILEVDIPVNCEFGKIQRGDAVFIAQIFGGRLPAGATTLPDNFTLKFFNVIIL